MKTLRVLVELDELAVVRKKKVLRQCRALPLPTGIVFARLDDSCLLPPPRAEVRPTGLPAVLVIVVVLHIHLISAHQGVEILLSFPWRVQPTAPSVHLAAVVLRVARGHLHGMRGGRDTASATGPISVVFAFRSIDCERQEIQHVYEWQNNVY